MLHWWEMLRWILVGTTALLLGQVSACGYPGSPAHASVAFSGEVIGPGVVATYSCEAGFELLGPSRRVCGDNGTWAPLGIPFCVLNVAAGKAPMQSSIVGTGVPQKAVDGSTSSFFSGDTCTMSEPERAPWWYVNLLEPYIVQLVRVDFGISCCANNRPATVVVRVGNNRPDLGVNPICNKFTGFLEEGRPLFLPCSTPMPGAFVSIHLEGPPGNPLSICEAFVYTDQALPIERCPAFRDQPLGGTSTYNGKCYTFYNNQPTNMEHARHFCELRGGSLVDETSPALQGFLSWELYRRHRNDPSGQYWMGAIRDPYDRKNWKWINGKDVTISFWNLPGTNENCSRFDGAKGWLWSDTDCNLNLNFICQHRPSTCGAPERPANSSILSRGSVEVGSVIEYRCDNGHLLVGPNIRSCLPNGFFSEFPPKCRFLECGPPASIVNGEYQLLNETRFYLSSLKYTCHEGFVLVGRGHLICDVDERWNGPPPLCEAVQCRSPPAILNGGYSLSNNSTVFGTRAEYSCSPGFRMIGDDTLHCLANGFWNGDGPVCQSEFDVDATLPDQFLQPSNTPHSEEPVPYPVSTIASISYSVSSVTSTTEAPMPPRSTARPLFPSRRPTFNPPRPRPSTHEIPLVTFALPEDNEVADTINIKSFPVAPPDVNPLGHRHKDPSSTSSSMSTSAKLNMGGIIALGVFGGFVFLAAIITIIVIIVRRTRNKRGGSPDNTTISTYDSSEHGLHKYYKRAWDNLRYEGKSPQQGFVTHPKLQSDHEAVTRQETLDVRGAREGLRDANEITEAPSVYSKKRPTPGSSSPGLNRQRNIQDWYNKQLGSRHPARY